MAAFLDSLAQTRGLFSILLTTIFATGAGYWSEGVLIEGLGDLSTGTWILFSLGLAAGAGLALLWASLRWSSAARGCFIHVVAESPGRLDRHRAEHTALSTWVSESWPDAPVLPFRPFLGGEEVVEPAAEQIVRQVRVAQALVPSSQQVTLLPGGPAHRVALLGAALAPHLQQGRVHLLSDSNREDKTPFLEFPLPAPSIAPLAQRVRGIRVLLIRGVATDEEAVKALDPDFLPIGETGLIPDTRDHYLSLVESIDRELQSIKTDTVLVLSAGPSSLTFAAGYLAAAHGFSVRSTLHVKGEGYREPSLTAPKVHAVINDVPASTQTSRRRKWWWALGLASLSFGLAMPTLSTAAALALEWLVGDSQAGQKLPLLQLLIMVATASVLTVCGWWINKHVIEAPEISIVLDPRAHQEEGKLTQRRLSAYAGGSLEHVAKNITDVYCDALAALPSATSYTVDVSAAPSASAADRLVTDLHWGLDRTLRGRDPITVSWRGQSTKCGPRERSAPAQFNHPVAEAGSG